MSQYNRLSALESQPTTLRRADDPESDYTDDPEFKALADSVARQLEGLTSKTAQLQNSINRLGTSKDSEGLQNRVKSLLEQARDGYKTAGDNVKRLQSWDDITPLQKFRQNQLVQQLQSDLRSFQAVQRYALEKQRQSATAARAALDQEEAAGAGEASGYGQQQQQLQQEQIKLASQDDVDFQESLIIQREDEIREIESAINEVNEMFHDINTIVVEQGHQIGNIESNVSIVVENSRGAREQLSQAARSQRRATGKMCFILIIFTAILAIVLLAATLG